MSTVSKSTFLIFVSMFVALGASCTRKASIQSEIKIVAPTMAELNKTSSAVTAFQWEGKKVCFAVNVLGDGIGQTGVCGQNMGAFAGFVDPGQTISITVARGAKRSFSLLGSVVEPSESCPSLSDIQNNRLLWKNIYNAGMVGDVTLDTEERTIEIPVSMEANSIGAVSGIAECGEQPGVIRAALLSSGIVVDGDMNQFITDDSSAIWESITYGIGINTSGWTYGSSSSDVAVRADSGTAPVFLNLPMAPFVRSLSQRPGTNEYYGLYEDGQIVAVDLNTGQATESISCPLDTCQVPAWIQSISIGNNQKVFALDHAGNIYQVTKPNGALSMNFIRSVSPIVSQLVFY